MSKIRNEDLVLKVSGNVDPNKWDEGRYDAFVDALCQGREYQKEAIFTALRFPDSTCKCNASIGGRASCGSIAFHSAS